MLLSEAKQILRKHGYILEADTRERIVATDKTIKQIVKREIEKYGNNADLNHIDVSNVTNMYGMFSNSEFNGDISNWKFNKEVDTTEIGFSFTDEDLSEIEL